MMDKEVITFGGVTIDIFINTKQEFVSKRLYHFPVGTKIALQGVLFSTGGGAGNAAASFSKFGYNTAILAKLGKDFMSHYIKQDLEKFCVKTGFIKYDKTQTGFSIILDAKGHDRTILTYRGANNNISLSDTRDIIRHIKLSNNKKLIYFASTMSKSFKTEKELARWCYYNKKKYNLITCFNPSMYMASFGARKLGYLLKSDMIIMNKKEAESVLSKHLTKSELAMHIYKIAKTNNNNPIVVITDGKHELVAFDGNMLYKARPNNVKVVESTGAGDAFSSTFCAAIFAGYSIENAIKLAIINAESVISHFGAKNKLLSEKELLKSLRHKSINVTLSYP